MRIDSSYVKVLTADAQKDNKNFMPKLNVNDEDFLNKSKIIQEQSGVTLELNTDNLAPISNGDKFEFTPAEKPSIADYEYIDIGYMNKYLGFFNSEVSLDDIREKGIDADTFSKYNNTGSVWGDKSNIDEFFLNATEKYSEILSQLSEKYADSEMMFNSHKDGLDRALRNYFTEKIHGAHVYAGISASSSVDEYNNCKYKANAENAVKNFIDNFDKNKDLKSQVDSALAGAFPEESTSIHDISLKDYKIIKETRDLFYNKGTGVDIMKSLSQNKDLSYVVRKAYEDMLNEHQYSNSSRYMSQV